MSRFLSCVVLLGLAGGPSLAAPPAAPPPAPVFGETVEVRVVNLEVTVTDRNGVPVTGLAAGDFELSIDGSEVPVKYFTEIRRGSAVAAETPSTETVAGVPDLVPGKPVGTSYLVFVDDFFALSRDRNRVLTSLRQQVARLQPEDRMAVVAYDGAKLEMLTSWTQSSRDLERVFRDAMDRPAGGLRRLAERRSLLSDRSFRQQFPSLAASRREALDTRLDLSERAYADTLQNQLRNEVAAVTAALRSFANPPGRKVLLLLAGGWPYDVVQFVVNQTSRLATDPSIVPGEKIFAPLIDTANQVGYTVFPVDVPGMTSQAVSDVDSVPGDRERFSGFLRENNEQYTLERVARGTGGKALLNSQRMQALVRAETATRTYYWIGFVPQWEGNDRRHQVEVRVRKPGLTARARSGYVDFSRKSEISAEVESVLLFGSGPGVQPLDLMLGQPTRDHGHTMRVPMSLSIPTSTLTLLPGEGARTADLELRVAAVDERGARSEMPVVPIRLSVPDERSPSARARFETTLELRRTRNHVVVAVYDPVSGTLWSATADVRP